MPELPEVETVVRGLLVHLPKRKILSVDIYKPLVLKSPRALFVSRLSGATVEKISRHGKCIFWTLNDRSHVKIHLGMTGALLFCAKDAKPDPYVRVRFRLDHPELDLVFRDVRQFGRVEFAKRPFEKNWGPDAWDSSVEQVYAALRKKKGMIKHALMNQNVVAGLGNIYVDETLFGAKVHPKKKLERLSNASLKIVCETARRVLGESLQARGTSFRDYVNTAGKRGDFKRSLHVYGQQSKPCTNCGTPIKKIIVASRGTHYCPRCQKS